MSNNVVSDSKQISRWDAGVMGSASYNVSRKLAVDIQYRYGLSTYMYQGDQALRNSGVGLGLNYMFGRP
jgi:opacity protein-like surface antigen